MTHLHGTIIVIWLAVVHIKDLLIGIAEYSLKVSGHQKTALTYNNLICVETDTDQPAIVTNAVAQLNGVVSIHTTLVFTNSYSDLGT